MMMNDQIPTTKSPFPRKLMTLLTAVLCAAVVMFSQANAQQLIEKVNGALHAGELVVPVHQSTVLKLDVPFKELFVGNPEIADVLALTDRTIYVLGKGLGTTSLTVYGRNKKLIAIADLVVTHDIEGLKRRFHDLMPKERIEVRPANGSIILSGPISSSVRLARALAVAEQYAPGKVTNLMSVRGSQQVMLAVRFVEVARSVSKELGLNTTITAGSKIAVTTGDALLGAVSAAAFATGTLGTYSAGKFALDVLFDALEEKGIVKTLAEPNLIALSGDTASFLAGGEFPVPVASEAANGGTTVTVEFKEFGISLSFTPTVLDDGLINILVAPEVSKIDTTNSVKLTGFDIPGLTTRRVRTTVELRDGQSFAIAGLIQSDFQDTIRQFPGLGDVPVLSGLFRSTDFQRNETELVIIVTPHLVKPALAGTLKTPADNFVPPSDPDMFLFGRLESRRSGRSPDAGALKLNARGAGGISGSYGHIIK